MLVSWPDERAAAMPTRAATGRHKASRTPAWKLEDAKARFSEVVRRARTEGPQRVTVRGKDAVVVIAAEALDKLLPAAKPRQDLVAFLQGLGTGDLNVARERDTGRDITL
jgi:prevent-host-death family protein